MAGGSAPSTTPPLLSGVGWSEAWPSLEETVAIAETPREEEEMEVDWEWMEAAATATGP